MLKKLIVIGGLLLAAVGNPAFADEAEDIAKVREVLKDLMPQAQPDSVKSSGMPGMYEAVFGPQVLYVSADGRFMLEGDLYDLKTRINLTEAVRDVGRAKVIAALDEKGMIIFAPEQFKHTVTAFTDIDCGYCRKMHKQMSEYNALGIRFRYLSYPRSGLNTASYYKAAAVWCADDRQAAMTKAKSGAKLEEYQSKDCDNPIKEHMAAANKVGVKGTPTLVLENGRVIPGYVEPKRLLTILEQLKKS
ncbi:MAG: DsbC family protein [Gammaproteobacteria bacterium]|nr:DsbC family protein [Gammaproteobacteria bacterium]